MKINLLHHGTNNPIVSFRKFMSPDYIYNWKISISSSLLTTIVDNKDCFLEEEIQFLKELIKSENEDNIRIAYEIIKNK